MADIVKITKGQPFALFIPCVILNTDGTKEAVETDTLTDIQVSLQNACDRFSCEYHLHDRFIVLDLPANMPTGEFAAVISATLSSGRPFSLRIKRAFAVVEWDYQSNWRDYIVGDHIELTDQPLIAGDYRTDEELEELKADYIRKQAEAEAAKAQYESAKAEYYAKADALDGMAKETTAQEIKTLILQEGIERANEYATEIREIIGDWNNE